MYLAIMLIIVAVLVFYNEYNKKMNIAEIGLLIIALIAIIRASMNYVSLSDTSKLETFTTSNAKNTNNTNNTRKSGNKSKGKHKVEDVIILESNKSKDYFDTNEENNNTIPDITQHNLSTLSGNKIDSNAVNQVNSLLGISTHLQSKFDNITSYTTSPLTTSPHTTSPLTTSPLTTKPLNTNIENSNNKNSNNGIESVFMPQIQIGKTEKDSLSKNFRLQGMNTPSLASNSAELGSGDNMTFSNTMKPSGNLWSSDLDYMDLSTNWSQSLADYNKGKWNPNTYAKASDFIDYYTPMTYGMSTPSKTNFSEQNKSDFNNIETTTTAPIINNTKKPSELKGENKKLCGAYDDLSQDQAGNLVVQNYTQAKKWMPGYTYVPPVYWDVPQKHIGNCNTTSPDVHKLTGLVDRGLPINALELNPDGSIANTEDTVSLTNIGSILPKFYYQETPFSKPYI